MQIKKVASIDKDKYKELKTWLKRKMDKKDIDYIMYKRIKNLIEELKEYNLIE